MPKLATLLALHMLAARYHSGQWSIGYHMLCRTGAIARQRLGIRSLQDLVNARTRPEFLREYHAEYRRFYRAIRKTL